MASLLLLKRKIKTTQNVSKTTKAMQMIAASKLNKAQSATLASRPFVDKITSLTKGVSSKLEEEQKHPYLKDNPSQKTLAIVFAPDKGLCGSLVTNLLREVIDFDSENKNTQYVVIGKKAQSGLLGLGEEIVASFDLGTVLPKFDQVLPLMEIINQKFISGEVGKVKIIYTNFKNVFSQVPQVQDLLPLKLEIEEVKERSLTIFEPNAKTLLPGLLRQYLEMNLYQYFLETYLSFQAAQMIAMQNATNNALDLVKNLKLEYNKTRQEKITNEILDIGSAAIFAI